MEFLLFYKGLCTRHKFRGTAQVVFNGSDGPTSHSGVVVLREAVLSVSVQFVAVDVLPLNRCGRILHKVAHRFLEITRLRLRY